MANMFCTTGFIGPYGPDPLATCVLRHAAGCEKLGQRGRHHRATCHARTRAQAFVVEKEEGFFLLDRPPDRGAEIIPLEAGLLLAGDIKVVFRVQRAVADDTRRLCRADRCCPTW